MALKKLFTFNLNVHGHKTSFFFKQGNKMKQFYRHALLFFTQTFEIFNEMGSTCELMADCLHFCIIYDPVNWIL